MKKPTKKRKAVIDDEDEDEVAEAGMSERLSHRTQHNDSFEIASLHDSDDNDVCNAVSYHILFKIFGAPIT